MLVNGIQVLAVQYRDVDKTPYVGVGFVKRAKFKTFAGVEISDVAPLNGFYRPDLEKAVREAGFEGMLISLIGDSQ